MSHYVVPAQPVLTELEIKKSRFIAYAARASSREEAMRVISHMQGSYPDARHHCWAYVTGNPSSATSAAMNDDGEPSGTAGKPILNVIQHKNIGDIVVVVSRYFGGVKLGAGGLVRAYSGAAEQAVSSLQLTEKIRRRTVNVGLDFSKEQALRHWLAEAGDLLISVDYCDQVYARVQIRQEHISQLQAYCQQEQMQFELVADEQ